MDVHTASIAVASVAQAPGAEVVALGTIGTRPCASDTLIRPRRSQSKARVCVDAAGPCGYGLSRSLRKPGDVCGGVAPALRPKKAGARVTTDRRAAMPRARLLRSGDLTPVSGPAVDEEAIRDLRRARAETLRALQAATFRRTAFVRRHALRSPGRAHGRPAHRRWRSEVGCPTPAPPMVCQEDVQTVTAQTARLGRLALARHEQGHTWRLAPVVEALQALRGVQVPVAVTLGAALGALTRCDHPRQRMHSLGVTPSASARGPRRPPGRLTKTGNTPARRARVEGAWASRSPATGRRHLPRRLEKLPAGRQALSGQAQGRRCTRSRQRMAQGNKAQQGVVALARAWSACMGAMAKQGAGAPQASRGRRVDGEAGEVSNRSRQRRRPGVVSPSAAL
jgi:transposase